MTGSVGGSIAVGPLGAMGTGRLSALISVGGEELLATVGSVEEEEDGLETASALTEGRSVLRKADGTLSLTIRGSFLAGFLDLLLLGAVADG